MTGWILGFCERCKINRYFEKTAKLGDSDEEDVEDHTYSCSSCGLHVFEVPHPRASIAHEKPKKKKKFRF